METVYGQTLALWLGDEDEHCTLELDTTGLNVKGNLYLISGTNIFFIWVDLCLFFSFLSLGAGI